MYAFAPKKNVPYIYCFCRVIAHNAVAFHGSIFFELLDFPLKTKSCEDFFRRHI